MSWHMTWSLWSSWILLGTGMLFSLLMGIGLGFLLGRRHTPADTGAPLSREVPPLPPPVLPEAPEPEPSGPDPFIYGSSGEKRQAIRRPGNPVPVLISDAAGMAPPFQGSVVDRSASGLRFMLDRPLAVGTILSVRSAHESALMPWIQVEVKNCQREGAGWVAGCQFVKLPPSSVLWSFG